MMNRENVPGRSNRKGVRSKAIMRRFVIRFSRSIATLSVLEHMNTFAAFPSNAVGMMLGSENDNLVFRVAGPELPVNMEWFAAN